MTSPPAAARPLSLSREGAEPTASAGVELPTRAAASQGPSLTSTPTVNTAPSLDRERGRAAAGGEVGVTHAATHVDPAWLAAARAARRDPTPAEALAWDLLRNRRCLGLKFRREQIVDGFRVDLYCAELRLSIEIDGGVHDDPEQRTYDELRTQALNALAIRVLRVRNEEVSLDTLERLLRPLLSATERGSR